MGYLPRSSFFLAIKMGSAVLMMHSQEIVVEAKESIKRQIQNTFKSNMLPMQRNLVNKQIQEADRKSTRLNSSHIQKSRMQSSA